MIKKLVVSAMLISASFMDSANAGTFSYSFNGAGVSGSFVLTYGAATDATYPQAYEVTNITGTFSDSNNGLNIVNAPILGLIPITRDTPEPTNLLAPKDFSRFAVASGLPPINNGFLTFDNLFWPGGSPQTASDYPAQGGFLDIYGLMFDIGGGRVVNFWSNGEFSGAGEEPIFYGAAVATSKEALDYVSVIPEPTSLALLGSGLLGLMAGRRAAFGTRSN